ncbi:hypothetical protein [Winogradskya humida]|uniref:Uncharacterized protein n=1 Tax=Winogradskya humida TaxID=113566 RepID=A0ABQ3ZP44_9ACTN|nr:hypothetical protein [Actinoplanes humidus]GIE20360.1 hypothetical protein Ahu01nite_034620 [Actinoplanes humidus]
MRGGLDDALDKLARRDELRRRANGESASSTPPAVNELVEAIAAVVGRNPELAVTVGVEGSGDPLLLHFAVEGGIVQVSADNTVVQRGPEPGHQDDVIDADLVEEPYPQPHPFAAAPPPDVPPQEEQRGFLPPLPEPIPLHVDEQETEQAAKRLAALLRADPSLLRSQD